MTATNRPLADLVRQGMFRSDLLYRLNVFSLTLLPLRQRRDDIIPIAKFFLGAYASARSQSFAGFTADAVESLLAYDFLGNARELRNIVERAAILAGGGEILPEHLGLPCRQEDVAIVSATMAGDNSGRAELDLQHSAEAAAIQTARWKSPRGAGDRAE